MIVRIVSSASSAVSAGTMLVALAICCCTTDQPVRAASPITPERPVPQLTEELTGLTVRFNQAQQDRRVLLDELDKSCQDAAKRYQSDFDGMATLSESVASDIHILAQAEVWKAALLAGTEVVFAANTAGELLFSGRDNLGWYAALLDAVGDREAVLALTEYAKIPAEAPELVAKVLAADKVQRAGLFDELAQRLTDDPKDPGVTMAVEMILRRKVGSDDLQAKLYAAASALADQTSGSLRMYLGAVLRAERRRAIESMLNTNKFQLSGELPDGSEFNADSLAGKVVVVAFFAPQSSKCLAELRRLVKLYDQHHAAGLEIVDVISVQGANNLDEFLDRHPEVAWSQLIDAEAAQKGLAHPLAVEAGVSTYPSFFVIDRQGVLRSVDAATDLESIVAAILDGQ